MTIAAGIYALESKAFTGASIMLTTVFSSSYLAIAGNEFQDGRWSYWLSRAKWLKSPCEYPAIISGIQGLAFQHQPIYIGTVKKLSENAAQQLRSWGGSFSDLNAPLAISLLCFSYLC
jgi:hypothetical protein